MIKISEEQRASAEVVASDAPTMDELTRVDPGTPTTVSEPSTENQEEPGEGVEDQEQDKGGDEGPSGDDDPDAENDEEEEAAGEDEGEESGTSSDDDPEQDKESDDGKQKKKKRKKDRSAKGRIDELTRQKYEALRALEAEKKAREELAARIAALEKGETPQSPDGGEQKGQEEAKPSEDAQEPKPPNTEDFYDDVGDFDATAFAEEMTKYQKELVAYELERRTKEQESRAEKERKEAEARKQREELAAREAALFEEFDQRAAEYAAESETYKESEMVLNQMLVDPALANENNPYGFRSQTAQALSTAILTTPNGPALIDYLAQNPGEADELLSSDPASAMVRVGALSAKLADGGRGGRRRASRAKPPPTTVAPGGAPAGKSLAEIAASGNLKEYAKRRGLLRGE